MNNPYTYPVREQAYAPVIDNLTDSDKLVQRPPFFEPLAGLEDKAHRAAQEKFILIVVAWKYPPPANVKENPKPIWRSTMAVDRPDLRDLNAVVPKMHKAALPFFDREIAEPELSISQPLPEGHVRVGELRVMYEPKRAPK